MTNRFLVFEKPDGYIAVVQIFDSSLTEEEHIAKILNDPLHEGYMFKFASDELIMYSNAFFDAQVAVQTEDGWKIGIDMAKARNIYRDALRVLRQPHLEKLDYEYQLALENNDTAKMQDVVARKQILRDAPNDPAINKAADLNDLRRLVPDVLLVQ